jgi:hypothetical protein
MRPMEARGGRRGRPLVWLRTLREACVDPPPGSSGVFGRLDRVKTSLGRGVEESAE